MNVLQLSLLADLIVSPKPGEPLQTDKEFHRNGRQALTINCRRPSGDLEVFFVQEPENFTVEDFIVEHFPERDPTVFLDLLNGTEILEGHRSLADVAKGQAEIILTVVVHTPPARISGAEIVELDVLADLGGETFSPDFFYFPVRFLGQREILAFLEERRVYGRFLPHFLCVLTQKKLQERDFGKILKHVDETEEEIFQESALEGFYSKHVTLFGEKPSPSNPRPIWVNYKIPPFVVVVAAHKDEGPDFQFHSFYDEKEFENFIGGFSDKPAEFYKIETTSTKVAFIKK